MKKSEPIEWTYTTQHADVMLWQYCCGLFDMIPRIDRDKAINVFEHHMIAKVAQIDAIYGFKPSFTVKLTINQEAKETVFEMEKCPN